MILSKAAVPSMPEKSKATASQAQSSVHAHVVIIKKGSYLHTIYYTLTVAHFLLISRCKPIYERCTKQQRHYTRHRLQHRVGYTVYYVLVLSAIYDAL